MKRCDRERLVAGLNRAAHFGPYFQADLQAAPGGDLDIAMAIDAMALRLGTNEARVAASYLQYEVAEHAWGVALGTWAFTRTVPDFTHLRLGNGPHGSVVFGFADLEGWNCLGESADDVAELLRRNVVDGLLEDFHRRLRCSVKVSEGLLWGNAATALVLSAQSAGRARSCVDVAAALLNHAPLRDRLDDSLTGSFRRRSCCLYYRAAGGRKCSDCPLA